MDEEAVDEAVEGQQDNNNYVNFVMCDMSMLYLSMCDISIGFQTQV